MKGKIEGRKMAIGAVEHSRFIYTLFNLLQQRKAISENTSEVG